MDDAAATEVVPEATESEEEEVPAAEATDEEAAAAAGVELPAAEEPEALATVANLVPDAALVLEAVPETVLEVTLVDQYCSRADSTPALLRYASRLLKKATLAWIEESEKSPLREVWSLSEKCLER